MKEQTYVKVGEESVKGFRKGITKKSLIESMSEEDWQRLDKFKKLNTISIDNEAARILYIQSDNLNIERDKLLSESRNIAGSILEQYDAYLKFTSNIEAGKTNEDGESVRLQKAAVIKIEALIHKALTLLKANLSTLYNYTSYKMIDGETPVYTLAEWNKEVEYLKKLIKDETGYNLY